MNRIILIGNGFDLAHRMSTKYHDFINDYWVQLINSIRNSPELKFENNELIINKSPSHTVSGKTYLELKEFLKDFGTSIKFKNRFLKEISEKTFLNNWVDVENEYYDLLKKSFDNSNESSNRYDIKDLNSDFEGIKQLLVEYLKKEELNFNQNLFIDIKEIIEKVGFKIYSPFKLKDFSESSLNKYAEYEYNFLKSAIEMPDSINENNELNEKHLKLLKYVSIENSISDIKRVLKQNSAHEYFDLIPVNTLFLNFNYTSTHEHYRNPKKFDFFDNKIFTTSKFISIHGRIGNLTNNPIIFGFGDELDNDYQKIERLNKNEYLDNIKSINYLNAENYKNLLEFINSDIFQVFIFGHSCGISDRTLLNTLFEHDNCGSIKFYYHQITKEIDNYSDVIRNISRNFNDKAKMRDRVVNKIFCESLL